MDEFRPTVAGKPRELQGFLNAALYHPIAGALARALVPTPVTPNMVSVFGAVMVVTAGVFYTLVGGAWGIAIGFLLHLSWHVVDGADGMLARLSGRASPRGEVVDGMCDYFGHGILYALLAAQLDGSLGWVAWVIALGAGVSRAVQSVYAESARRSYQWWVYDVPWLQNQRAPQPGLGGALSRAYLRAWNTMSGATRRVDALVVSAEHDAPERARIAELNPLYHYLEIVRAPMLGQSVDAYHWWIVLACTAVGLLLAFVALRRFRSRVPYWV